MTTVRVSLDLGVERGEPEKLAKILSDPAVHKKVAEFLAHSVIPGKTESISAKPVGGHAHLHEPSGSYACDVCMEGAGSPVFKKYRR